MFIYIVDGRLSDWGSWSQCSATCEGLKSRNRTCIPPQYGGASCTGQTTQTIKCGSEQCPGILFQMLLQIKFEQPLFISILPFSHILTIFTENTQTWQMITIDNNERKKSEFSSMTHIISLYIENSQNQISYREI